MSGTAFILDGYVDEPACLGVPPYISPYIRTVAGALLANGYTVRYLTIDQLRKDPLQTADLNNAGLLVMIAGVTVPGKYLGGTPATLTEIQQVGHMVHGPKKLIGGPIGFGYAGEGGEKAIRQVISGFDALLEGEPAVSLDNYLMGNGPSGLLDYARTDPWSITGSSIINQHPSFPYVMCELETARGCSHGAAGGCSFCTEPFYGMPRYRSIPAIADEVAALHTHGARHFRVGRQPDILAYGAGSGEYPAPEPEKIDALFAAIRTAAPDLKTLHIDNTNPATIARHEEKAREALRAIIRHHTPGDVAAFGMETADPAVVTANNLKAGADEVFRAVQIVNEEGGMRRDNVPELLPGLNFVCGLAGETERTYELNEQFLDRVLKSGLSVRRVNIRQVMPFPGTQAYTDNTLGKHDRRFKQFKEYVRSRIDLPMLQRVFPVGTVLKDVIIEESGDLSFGRQMGSYPILAGIPLRLPVRTVTDAVVVDWGMRSVTALPVPVRINELPATALRWLPGVGKKKVAAVVAKRPFGDMEAYRKVAGSSTIDPLLAF
ncbi:MULTISPECIES: radical SAM protein [unclassified Methanoregula]|uniref:radical SAM protein n=1 Tax=unclassified Methanoregula TaxID=2649730 RepID=UPI0009CD77DC|nr:MULTISPECIES: radical SAM protein [unclassified Methanoregula]OPX64123.1 MAG: Radical SAM superfamily protein [Methanoregula sp. PtaB.Bin085]OPY34757.1 MAG: Radical SAM superfamily protein [Methanoregula sp. PtaU1.Bin006]